MTPRISRYATHPGLPLRRLVLIPLFSACCIAAAASAPPFSGDTDVAYLRSTGAAGRETFKGRVDMTYVDGSWTHEFKGEALNESDGDTGARIAERYLALIKSGWSFTASDYLFIKEQYEKDQQTDDDYQALLAAGYGRLFVRTDTLRISAEAGAGARHSKARRVDAGSDETVGNMALGIEWKFRQGGRFTEDASADVGEKSAVVRTRSAVLLDLTDVLGLSVTYETKHDDAADGVDNSLTTVGLNYRFR